jgi:hypothetical protein
MIAGEFRWGNPVLSGSPRIGRIGYRNKSPGITISTLIIYSDWRGTIQKGPAIGVCAKSAGDLRLGRNYEEAKQD